MKPKKKMSMYMGGGKMMKGMMDYAMGGKMDKDMMKMYATGGMLKALLKDPKQREMAKKMLGSMEKGGMMKYQEGGITPDEKKKSPEERAVEASNVTLAEKKKAARAAGIDSWKNDASSVSNELQALLKAQQEFYKENPDARSYSRKGDPQLYKQLQELNSKITSSERRLKDLINDKEGRLTIEGNKKFLESGERGKAINSIPRSLLDRLDIGGGKMSASRLYTFLNQDIIGGGKSTPIGMGLEGKDAGRAVRERVKSGQGIAGTNPPSPESRAIIKLLDK